MSQEGKVLHLYVEVRSVPEDGGKGSARGDDDTTHLMLQCPDVLPHSQRSSAHSSPNRSPAPSPVTQHYPGARNHSLPSSKSSSRHSVSFHLQNPDATGSPTQYARQQVLPDSFGQLLEVLAPGTVGSSRHGSLGRTFSLDVDPYQGKMLISPSSGRMNASSPPTRNRRSYEVEGIEDDEGKTSVVSFGYIEKSNVHNMAGRRASACQNEYNSSFNKMEGQLPPHLRKRLSDPVWHNGQPPLEDPSHGHHYSSHSQSPRDLPSLQKATLDSAARDATHRALEEFGSPELKRRLAGYGPESYSYSPTLPRQQQSPRCRSWGGSPILPRTARTLPPKTQLLQLDQGVCHSSVTGLPRSPASDQLCAHIGHSSHSKASAPHSLNQHRLCVGVDSPRLANKFHPPLPAGRPTDIQHELPAGSFPSVNPSRTDCLPSHRVTNGYNTKFTNSGRG
ncbi:uncharacterized protein LOC115399231 [Salarias fasciatus]|uniref:uncharacterized protein LOC115399231 n=1 Tax=Salarias fasciatus TaxID=181472 RepID=UPI001176D814|nr:uncharacterized protein LOC115399231 [Salarias fasciatus]